MVLALILVAGFETWDGWSSQPDINAAGNVFFLARAYSQPMLGLAALIFALTGRIRHAIVALAAIVMLRWLSPALLEPSNWKMVNFFSAQETIMQFVLVPVAALAAGSLAMRNHRLGLATALVCLPALYNLVLLAGFFIGVMLYGF